jgi:hypothetical protein
MTPLKHNPAPPPPPQQRSLSCEPHRPAHISSRSRLRSSATDQLNVPLHVRKLWLTAIELSILPDKGCGTVCRPMSHVTSVLSAFRPKVKTHLFRQRLYLTLFCSISFLIVDIEVFHLGHFENVSVLLYTASFERLVNPIPHTLCRFPHENERYTPYGI